MSPGSKVEDAGSGGIGENKVRLVVVPGVRLGRNFARGLIMRVAIGLNCDGIVLCKW